MEKLKIINNLKSNDTITRTIRMNGTEENHLSFNNVTNQILEFGLKNLDNQ